MANNKFLYGASVQGIQSFIFQTNTLREIAGASELVEQICTNLFAETIGSDVNALEIDFNTIVTAAGHIKYVFNNEAKCRDLVKKFPMNVMQFAPGITISQAVVKIEGDITKEHIDELERRLRTQRNKPIRPFDVGLMAMNRSRKTGLPAVDEKTIKGKLTIIDSGTKVKLETESERVLKSMLAENIKKEQIPWDMKDITNSASESYTWLAVVHADGNNMGIALQQLVDATKNSKGEEFIKVFRKFSLALDKSTKEAAKNAYDAVYKNESNKKIPFRPIIIGGDDLTIICRGDLALKFTKYFLANFKEITQKYFEELPSKINFLKKGLTACAGIAYIKESYPFHYGYHLAETLCTEAKIATKTGLEDTDLTPSCLMFHKVQDSFVEDFKTIKERELKAGDICFDFGPYYLESTGRKPTIEQFEVNVAQLEGKDGNAVKSHLRQWLTDLYNEPGLAAQKLHRLVSMSHKSTYLGLPDSAIQNGKSPVYDWLTIHSINQGGK